MEKLKVVTKRDDIVDNIKVLETALHSKDDKEKKAVREMVKSGDKLVAYKVKGDNHFAPAGFVAVKDHTIAKYQKNVEAEEIQKPDKVMEKVVGLPFSNSTTEEKFAEYLEKLGMKPPKNERKFWRLKDERRKNLDLNL